MEANKRDRAHTARRGDRAPAHSMPAKNRRVCAGDFALADNGTRGKHHAQPHQTVCKEPPAAQAAKAAAVGRGLGRGRHLFIAGTTLDRRRSASRLTSAGRCWTNLAPFRFARRQPARVPPRQSREQFDPRSAPKDRWIDLGGRANILPHLFWRACGGRFSCG